MSQHDIKRNEIDLVDYIKIVYKAKWIVIAIVCVAVAYNVFGTFRQPDIYEASATFFPLSAEYGVRQEGLIVKPRLRLEDLIISVLESRKMADRIIEQLDLKDIWNIKSLTTLERILKASTVITLEDKGLINLFVHTRSPKLSARIANAYVDNLNYFNRQLDIGAQRQIVQVIDRAVVPESKMPREFTKKAIKAGFVSFSFIVILVLLIGLLPKSDIIKRLREK